MYSFKNDYAEGAHPAILEALNTSNLHQEQGYGEDQFSLNAKAALRTLISQPSADIYFVAGGTLANQLVISTLLRSHEAVISAQSGHIYANEAGAIEHGGHRIISLPAIDGKITPEQLYEVVNAHALRPHVVKPRLVYVSNSTEWGTIYKKKELKALFKACKALDLYLFMDGARLGHALMSPSNDLTMEDIGQLTDIFYIGGTKNGALLGEAIVFNDPTLSVDFDYLLKQRGALLAKGRVLGIQFYTLFGTSLYFDLAQKANTHAQRLAQAFIQEGFEFYTPVESNQLFPIVPLKWVEEVSKKFAFYVWQPVDDLHVVVRLITSWATDPDQVDALIVEINRANREAKS